MNLALKFGSLLFYVFTEGVPCFEFGCKPADTVSPVTEADFQNWTLLGLLNSYSHRFDNIKSKYSVVHGIQNTIKALAHGRSLLRALCAFSLLKPLYRDHAPPACGSPCSLCPPSNPWVASQCPSHHIGPRISCVLYVHVVP